MDICKRLLLEFDKAIPMSAEAQTKESLTQNMSAFTKTVTVASNSMPKRFKCLDEDRTKFLYSPMSICVTELSQFAGTGGAAHMLDYLTTIYDEYYFKSATKGKGTDLLPLPYLTMLACTVPDWIANQQNSSVISSGFARRTIFVYEDQRQPRIAFPDVTDEMQEAWVRVVTKSRGILQIKGAFTWGPDTKAFYQNWYDTLPPPDDPMMDGWYNSVPVQMLKIAMLLCASDWTPEEPSQEITLQHLTDAIDLIRLVESNMPKVFSKVGRNELFGISSKIVEMLRLAPGQACPERLVKKDLFREANIEELSKMISHLIATKQIRKEVREHPVTKLRESFLVIV